MEFNGFTDKANDALNCALTCAMSMGHTYVGSEHILYGLCGSNGGVAYTVLRQSGVTCNSIASRINALIGKGLPTQLTVSDFTPRSRRILESAVMIARNAGKTAAGTDHILRAIMRDNECYASVFLHEMGISGQSNHRNMIRPGAYAGHLDGNPVREDIEETAAYCHPHFRDTAEILRCSHMKGK